jgi:hypothetical protein
MTVKELINYYGAPGKRIHVYYLVIVFKETLYN